MTTMTQNHHRFISHRMFDLYARTSGRMSLSFASSFQKTGTMPRVSCSWIRHVRLWQRNLQRTSLTIAVSVLLMTESPNFRLTAEKVLSIFDRWR